MDVILGGLAFASLIAAQFLAVIAAHRERLRDGEGQGQLRHSISWRPYLLALPIGPRSDRRM
jgi:hypothetical protein